MLYVVMSKTEFCSSLPCTRTTQKPFKSAQSGYQKIWQPLVFKFVCLVCKLTDLFRISRNYCTLVTRAQGVVGIGAALSAIGFAGFQLVLRVIGIGNRTVRGDLSDEIPGSIVGVYNGSVRSDFGYRIFS